MNKTLQASFRKKPDFQATLLEKIHRPFILLKSRAVNLPGATFKEMTMDLLTSIPVRVIGFESTPQLLDDLRERIARKAYLNCMDRGAVDGQDLDDWLRAERELIIRAMPKIKAEADDVFVELELPEVELSNLTVRLSPRQLLISSDPDDQGVQFCQMIDLPVEISMDGVDAEQARNLLHITAAAALPRPEGQMAASRCA